MSDHYNLYPLKHFAATVAECMDFQLPETYAQAISWVSNILKDKMGGNGSHGSKMIEDMNVLHFFGVFN